MRFYSLTVRRPPIRILPALIAAIVLALAPNTASGDDTADPAALANPLAGTTRGEFPGADMPFGMVQYSPNTNKPWGGGYNYWHPQTSGFATTHLSGPGCPAMGDIVSLPTTGPVTDVDVTRQRSSFSHKTEQASPGYYAVDLNASKVHAELTATPRTGWARFTYPATGQANVLVDPGANLRGARDADVKVIGNDTLEGSVATWGYWNACPTRSHNRYKLRFQMKFDRPFASFGVGNGKRITRGGRRANGKDAGAYVTFDSAADPRPVVATVGISFVDLPGARRNLATETGTSFDFDAVRAAARNAWNGMLGRVDVSGGDLEQQRTFYTALYHSLLHPNVFSDADGRYRGFDNRIYRTSGGQTHYTSFSMWDTYRSEHQVLDLVAPDRVPDMMRSLVDDSRQAGWMPKWVYAQYETNEMVGDPAANVIADAYVKGLMRPDDVQAAYRALMKNATEQPDARKTPFEGRTGIEQYVNRGFVPYRNDGDYSKSASVNMEYGLNDCALALMARRLGFGADWRYMLRRSKRFRHSVDPSSRFVRPRLDSGKWIVPFNPRRGQGFKEGTSWQYTWLAPQDVPGLSTALGGRGPTLEKLDSFFAYDKILAHPASAYRIWKSLSRHNPQNEVGLHSSYLYNYLGQPWKTQDVVRAGETLFSSKVNGLPSSDDLGAQSSWYVLSALGIYPTMAGDDKYALTSPLFEHAVVHLPGRDLVIEAPGAPSSRYIDGVSLNGQPVATSDVSHADLTKGAVLSFSLGTSPNTSWATGANVPASACAANPRTADMRLTIGGTRHNVLTTRVTNTGDGPARRIGVRLRLPGGWSATARSAGIGYLGAHRSATQRWRLRGPRGRHSGNVHLAVNWSGPGGTNGGALRTSVSGRSIIRRGR